MIRAAPLWRSTPVRQALTLVAVFATVNLLTTGAAYLTLRAALLQRIETRVAEEFAGMDFTATPGALATLVAARARATDPARTVYAFRGSDGRMAGNATAIVENGHLHLRASAPDKPLSEAGYVQRIERLSGGVLVVAESLAPIAELRRIFLAVLAFSLAPTTVLSLGLAMLIARNSARRVRRIEAALDRLAQGELGTRVAPDPSGDDLARIGGGVNRMAGKQQAATEAIRQVSADIAHDLRTPLQRIAVLLEDLGRALPEDGEAANLAERARTEAERASAVFRGLLQIAQIEGGRPAETFRPVDLTRIARDIGELYTPVAEDRGDTLTVTLAETPEIQGDPDLIGQALANLLENALRHTQDGAAITLAVGPGPTLTVADDGTGIPQAERQNVLKRLYRLDRSRTTPGNGLGLPLVAAIAEAHGATLTLGDSDPGLTVTLAFPSAMKQSAATSAKQ